MPPVPAIPGLFSKSDLRKMYAEAEYRAARKAGFDDPIDRMAHEINKNSEAYWTFQKLRPRVEPKEVSITADNSAEALMGALERLRAGQEVEYIDVEVDALPAAEPVAEVPAGLWPESVVRSRA